jgi:hypothetical protein
MFDHFHLLVEVPKRPVPGSLPDDRELVRRARMANYSSDSQQLRKDLAQSKTPETKGGGAGELREQLFARMWDVSWFMKMLKQRFTQWYNRRNQRHGTLWEERYRSVPIEEENLLEAALGIDLNPVRHRLAARAEDYGWSGFGQAANGLRAAREGLRIALEARFGQGIAPQRILPEYRAQLEASLAQEPQTNGKNGHPGHNGGQRKRRQLRAPSHAATKPKRSALL